MRHFLTPFLCLPLLALLLLAAPAWGATYYMDQKCPTAGNGTSAVCSAGPTTNNPKKDMTNAIALLANPGDILNVRGIHAAHGNCPGDTAGRWLGDRIVDVSGKVGNAGAHIIIQAYGWTAIGAGTQETVYIEGVAASGSNAMLGWTQCTVCNSGTCNGVPGTCGDVWWTDLNATGHPAGNMTRCVFAVQPNGKPTVRQVAGVIGPENVINQYDSFSDNSATAKLFVRWGQGADAPAGANNPFPYVVYDAAAGFDVRGSSSFVEIRGFTIRNQTSAGISGEGQAGQGADNLFAYDNKILYVGDRAGNGSDRPITILSMTHATIEGNDISCSGSEGIHTQAAGTAGAPVTTVLTIRNNWIHDLGQYCATILGPQVFGSPAGLILGDSSDLEDGGVGAGDYTGSILEGNLIQRVQRNGGSHVTCWAHENNSSGWIDRNNVCDTVGGTNSNDVGIEMTAGCGSHGGNINCANNAVSNNQVYNNIIANVPGTCIEMDANEQTQTANGNSIYNNIFSNCGSAGGGTIGGLQMVCNGSGCASNLFRNNILYNAGNVKLVNVPVTAAASNVLDFDLITSTANPVATWRGTNYSCAQLATPGANNIINCPDPLFMGANDFRIKAGSPAIDVGTATGMPAGRTTDICNSLAVLHGLPDYHHCIGQQ